MIHENEPEQEHRRLSSASTLAAKFGIPGLVFVAFGVGTLLQFILPAKSSDFTPGPDERWNFLVAWLVGTAFVWFLVGTVKEVRIDGRALYVSNFFRHIVVPLTDVTNVEYVWYLKPAVVTVHFRYRTAFGWAIDFLPGGHWVLSWAVPPVVEEIRAAAERARAESPPSLPSN